MSCPGKREPAGGGERAATVVLTGVQCGNVEQKRDGAQGNPIWTTSLRA